MTRTKDGDDVPRPARTIRTRRLDLVPATPETLRAAREGPEALAKALGALVPATWPHEHLDNAALAFTIDRLHASPASDGWLMHFIVERGEAARGGPSVAREGREGPRLVGSCGYKGPPSADGTVEIGYGIVSDQRRRGFAVEACRALVDRAFGMPGVERVVIETLPDLTASIGVARRLGFREAGAGSEPGAIRFEIRREEWRGRGEIHIRGPAENVERDAERVLRTLAEWFAIEESLLQYVANTKTLPTFVAEVDGVIVGFVALRSHFDHSWEIDCIAVERSHRNGGVGRALQSHAEEWLRTKGAHFLQVKTLAETHTSEEYGRTRRFYERVGFRPLEVFPTLWSPRLPVLQLVKAIAP